jgi:hypothetical protein
MEPFTSLWGDWLMTTQVIWFVLAPIVLIIALTRKGS